MPSRVLNDAARHGTRLVVVALCIVGGLAPAVAQSLPLISPQYGEPPQPTAITVRLLAVARPTVAFLSRASGLAETEASKRLRGFARREMREQEAVEAALAAAAAPTLVTRDPLDVAAVGAASVDEGAETILSAMPRLLRTPGARAVAADRAIATSGNADLGRLTTLSGRSFDALYVATQIDGLSRLVNIYRDYTQNGDDEGLRAVTVHELPRVVARLADIKRFWRAGALAEAVR